MAFLLFLTILSEIILLKILFYFFSIFKVQFYLYYLMKLLSSQKQYLIQFFLIFTFLKNLLLSKHLIYKTIIIISAKKDNNLAKTIKKTEKYNICQQELRKKCERAFFKQYMYKVLMRFYNNIHMSLDFQEILLADAINQFDYIEQLNLAFDNFSSSGKESTQMEQREDKPLLRKIDPFSEPKFIKKSEYCKNSIFMKKIVALNTQISVDYENQKSHQNPPKLSLKERQLQSQISVQQSLQSSQFRNMRKKKRKGSKYQLQDIKSKKPIKQGKGIKKSRSKKTQPKKDPYPTKNILPCFRSFFVNQILQKSPQCQSLQIIQRIKGKPCINLTDCAQLFNHPQTRPILANYFERKQLYRDLLQSRVQLKLKLIYHSKIPVFQEAFRLGVFNGIN